MNKRIRFFILVCIVISIISIFLFTLLPIIGGKYLVGSSYDTRAQRSIAEIKRGNIYSRDNELINFSIYEDDKYIRKYNFPGLYSHLVGYVDYKYGSSGLENYYNSTLQGVSKISSWSKIQNTIFKYKSGEHIRLSINHDLQKLSRKLLERYTGAIIITDPRNGDVLSYYSNPSFDERYIEKAVSSEKSVMLDRVLNGKYSPGSVFKIITSVNILNNVDNLSYNDEGSIMVGDAKISNYGNIKYGEQSLHEAIVNSSNAYFVAKGLNYTEELIQLTNIIDDKIKKSVKSNFAINIRRGNKDFQNALLQIGQGEVTVSPIAINLITQAVYNGGYFYKPNYIDSIISNDFKFERHTNKKKISLPIEKKQADYIKDSMFDVVRVGTARGYGLTKHCGGKTGTAQLPGDKYNYWFTGFILDENPKIVTIVVENISNMGYNVSIDIFKKLLKQNK